MKRKIFLLALFLFVGLGYGSITDVSGKAALNVKKGATLQVSFVGFKTQEVKAQGSLRVVLRDDNELLDEVVVVGYGTQKKCIRCRHNNFSSLIL